MRIFFDNNLSPHLAHALRELSKVENGVADVIHLRDRFQASAPDVEWIRALGETGPWTIISIDRFTKNNDAERTAIRNAGHSIFVLDRQWSEQKYWAVAERPVIWWQQILQQIRLVDAGAFRVPWHHNSRTKFQQIRL